MQPTQAPTRFSEAELDDMVDIIWKVFNEDEKSIPAGVEHAQLPKLPAEMLGDNKKKARKRTRKSRAAA